MTNIILVIVVLKEVLQLIKSILDLVKKERKV